MLRSHKVNPLICFNYATGFTHRWATQCNKLSFYLYSLFYTATTWFLHRVLKSCWRSSSRPDTRWCSPPRASSGLTDTWRTNTPMSGKATGSWALGVRPPVLSVTQLGQTKWLHFFTWCHFFPYNLFFLEVLSPSLCSVLRNQIISLKF